MGQRHSTPTESPPAPPPPATKTIPHFFQDKSPGKTRYCLYDRKTAPDRSDVAALLETAGAGREVSSTDGKVSPNWGKPAQGQCERYDIKGDGSLWVCRDTPENGGSYRPFGEDSVSDASVNAALDQLVKECGEKDDKGNKPETYGGTVPVNPFFVLVERTGAGDY
ncbi:MAG: hypothetical protein M1831_002933 [Alyxoria varia]|nr:MAG: hypothetical protein M1831_002933 [Alyxoria varia]